MTKKSALRLLMVVSGVAFAGAAGAADVSVYQGGSCVSYTQSALPSETTDTIRQTLWTNFGDAQAGMNDPRVQASSQPAYVWAMETRWACTAAIGYLDGGYIHEESIQKCDCFHQRYASLR